MHGKKINHRPHVAELDKVIFETWKGSGTPSYREMVSIFEKMGNPLSKSRIIRGINSHANRIGYGKPKSK